MTDNNCIFCKIAQGEIPSYTVYEDDTFRAILDAAPAGEGHTLILPKAHYENLYELPEETAAAAMKLAKRIAVLLKERTHCEGVNILQNNEAAAGQTVMHYHMHVIPRMEGDGHLTPWKPLTRTPEEQEATLQKLR